MNSFFLLSGPRAAFLLSCLLLAACSGRDAKAPSAGPPEVGYVAVVAAPQELRTELPGRTRASLSAEVRPQIGGIVLKRLFTEGSWVKAGQPLYELDARSASAAARSAEAAVAKARAVANTARSNAARNAELVKIDAVSRQVAEESEAQAAQAASDVAVAEAALATARVNLQYATITAPISGVADLSTVSVGALVSANQAQPLTTITQLDPMYVDITQSSNELLELRRKWQAGAFARAASGDRARVRLVLEDGSEYVQEGTLQFTGATVNTSTGAITLRASFPNPQRLLMPGMYVRATLTTGRNERAILVPQPAVLRDAAGKPSVLVIAAGDKLEKRPIEIGQAVGNQWLVISGLNPGDRVMVDGFQRARAGQVVRPVVAHGGDRVAGLPAGAASAPPRP